MGDPNVAKVNTTADNKFATLFLYITADAQCDRHVYQSVAFTAEGCHASHT